jgi:hypothetical protein
MEQVKKEDSEKSLSTVAAIRWLNSRYKTDCEHDWYYEGHGHNSDFYLCLKCKIEGEY